MLVVRLTGSPLYFIIKRVSSYLVSFLHIETVLTIYASMLVSKRRRNFGHFLTIRKTNITFVRRFVVYRRAWLLEPIRTVYASRPGRRGVWISGLLLLRATSRNFVGRLTVGRLTYQRWGSGVRPKSLERLDETTTFLRYYWSPTSNTEHTV